MDGCLRSIFRILQPFRYLSDSYVIEFFVEDLWNQIPIDWRRFFDSIDFQTLGEFLEIDQPFKPKSIVPPLSLLALRECVRIYALQRSPPMDMDEIYRLISGDRLVSIRPEIPPPQALLHMSPKKKHEIRRLGDLIDLLLRKDDDQNRDFTILDIGSGCGHLARYLTLIKNLNVTTIEARLYFVERAKIFDQKTVSRLRKSSDCRLPQHQNQFFDESVLTKSISEENRKREMWMIGLHTCGDLASAMLRSYVRDPSIEVLISVSCCYMKLSTAGDRLISSATDSYDDTEIGYPMSAFVKSIPDHDLSYAAREMSCHAMEQYSAKLRSADEPYLEHLKAHCYRAALERLIRRKYPNRKREGIRSVKNAHRTTMKDYVQAALSRLEGIDLELILDDQEWSTMMIEWKRVVMYYSVRLLLAPLIESIVLIDRLLYLKENGCKNAWIAPLFDVSVSARNFMLLAMKEK